MMLSGSLLLAEVLLGAANVGRDVVQAGILTGKGRPNPETTVIAGRQTGQLPGVPENGVSLVCVHAASRSLPACGTPYRTGSATGIERRTGVRNRRGAVPRCCRRIT